MVLSKVQRATSGETSHLSASISWPIARQLFPTFTRETSPNRSSGTSYNYDVVAFQEETFRNQAGFAALAYFPLGFDFRIGKRKTAWHKAHAFFELRPGVVLQVVPEANFTLLRSTTASQFGFRFDL